MACFNVGDAALINYLKGASMNTLHKILATAFIVFCAFTGIAHAGPGGGIVVPVPPVLRPTTGCIQVFAPTLAGAYKLEVTTLVNNAPHVTTLDVPNSPPSRFTVPGLTTPNSDVILTALVDGRAVDSKVVTVPSAPPIITTTLLGIQLHCQLVTLGSPAPGEFLVGRGDSRKAENLDPLPANLNTSGHTKAEYETVAKAYYDAIDPQNKKRTFADFKSNNGFGGPDELKISYANSGDLGFGRQMHCVKKPGKAPLGRLTYTVACYVTNYDSIDTPDPADLADAVAGTNPGATVAMEYTQPSSLLRIPGFVKFYAYGPNGNIIYSADLDGFGARPLPQLCMVCHGGKAPHTGANGLPDFSHGANLQAQFLPFDTRFFKLNNPATDHALFKQFNQTMVLAAGANPAIADVVNGMYANNAVQQNVDYVPPGWSSSELDKTLYKHVIAPACRNCHLSHDVGSDGIPSLATANEFRNYLAAVENRVFCVRDMPHAMATYDLFWASNSIGRDTNSDPFHTATNMPGLLKLYGKIVGANPHFGDCAAPPNGGGTPAASVPYSDVQAIFNNNCTSCHGSTSPSAGLSLAAPNARQNLINKGDIQAGNSSQSILYQKVSGVGITSGTHMPPAGLMNAANIATIKNWIDQGANP